MKRTLPLILLGFAAAILVTPVAVIWLGITLIYAISQFQIHADSSFI